jgi:hypothetical protein
MVRDPNTNETKRVLVDDPDFLSGRLVFITKGKKCARNKDNEYLSVSVDDPRLLTGELVPAMKGKRKPEGFSERMVGTILAVRRQDGTIFRIDKNHPDVLSGEVRSTNTRKYILIEVDGENTWIQGDMYDESKHKIVWKNKLALVKQIS